MIGNWYKQAMEEEVRRYGDRTGKELSEEEIQETVNHLDEDTGLKRMFVDIVDGEIKGIEEEDIRVASPFDIPYGYFLRALIWNRAEKKEIELTDLQVDQIERNIIQDNVYMNEKLDETVEGAVRYVKMVRGE